MEELGVCLGEKSILAKLKWRQVMLQFSLNIASVLALFESNLPCLNQYRKIEKKSLEKQRQKLR